MTTKKKEPTPLDPFAEILHQYYNIKNKELQYEKT